MKVEVKIISFADRIANWGDRHPTCSAWGLQTLFPNYSAWERLRIKLRPLKAHYMIDMNHTPTNQKNIISNKKSALFTPVNDFTSLKWENIICSNKIFFIVIFLIWIFKSWRIMVILISKQAFRREVSLDFHSASQQGIADGVLYLDEDSTARLKLTCASSAASWERTKLNIYIYLYTEQNAIFKYLKIISMRLY